MNWLDTLPDHSSRRALLQTMVGGSLGGFWPELCSSVGLALGNPRQPDSPRIKSCIFVFYYGGPSHLDTFDMKPDAPADIRGEFQSIATSLPGLRIGEHLPCMARIMHKVTVVRCMRHAMRGHDSASYRILTGKVPPVGDNQNFGERPDSFPCLGANLSYHWKSDAPSVPHVALPFVMNNNFSNPGQTSGFLGPVFQPLLISGDPQQLAYRAGHLRLTAGLTSRRLVDRALLRDRLSRYRDPGDAQPLDVYFQRALQILGARGVRQALEIDRETPATLEKYGHGPAGQKYDDNPKSTLGAEQAIARNLRGGNLLLARRVVEAGWPFVNVYDYKHQGKNWDSHSKNFVYLKEHLLPPADRALAALIEDLEDRGLLDSTLVVALGEFGRTPRINKTAGRDHWPDCFSAILAGGGIRAGYIHGASDRLGAYPTGDPVTPGDLVATVLHLFGISSAAQIYDSLGRPHVACDGKPVRDLLA